MVDNQRVVGLFRIRLALTRKNISRIAGLRDCGLASVVTEEDHVDLWSAVWWGWRAVGRSCCGGGEEGGRNGGEDGSFDHVDSDAEMKRSGEDEDTGGNEDL